MAHSCEHCRDRRCRACRRPFSYLPVQAATYTAPERREEKKPENKPDVSVENAEKPGAGESTKTAATVRSMIKNASAAMRARALARATQKIEMLKRKLDRPGISKEMRGAIGEQIVDLKRQQMVFEKTLKPRATVAKEMRAVSARTPTQIRTAPLAATVTAKAPTRGRGAQPPTVLERAPTQITAQPPALAAADTKARPPPMSTALSRAPTQITAQPPPSAAAVSPTAGTVIRHPREVTQGQIIGSAPLVQRPAGVAAGEAAELTTVMPPAAHVLRRQPGTIPSDAAVRRAAAWRQQAQEMAAETRRPAAAVAGREPFRVGLAPAIGVGLGGAALGASMMNRPSPAQPVYPGY